MSRKRAFGYDEEDGDFHFRSPVWTNAPKRLTSYRGLLENQQTHESSPAVILSGFMWSAGVDIWITRALEPYDALFMGASLDLPAQEKMIIKSKYGIQADFVKVVCGSWESRERLITDLDHAMFAWTTPYLEARKLDVEESPGVPRLHGSSEELARHVVRSGLQATPEQERREVQSRVWIKLSEAITNARAHLSGDDLDTFEALIAQPVPGVDPMERVRRWIRGSKPDIQPQRTNGYSQNVKGRIRGILVRTKRIWQFDGHTLILYTGSKKPTLPTFFCVPVESGFQIPKNAHVLPRNLQRKACPESDLMTFADYATMQAKMS
ncbi:hypothetical protein VTL71DRAFT_2215 [Oculimacula yallundae]|uniref:Uncharacterized protein n=1 Tax=Oculimacula yallundae TaxID=86028 RepID=A0ABR4C8A1_9HELO